MGAGDSTAILHRSEIAGIPSSGYIRVMAEALPQRDRLFRFLRAMRAEGRTNMYGAVPYLMRTFGIDRSSAFSVVCEWIDEQSAIIVEARSLPRQKTRPRISA